MKQKKHVFPLIFMMICILINGLCFADQDRGKDERKYEVSITNLTRGQIFSPPIVISHDRSFRLFTLGDVASDGLTLLAEEGNPDDLIDALNPRFDYAVADGPVAPGGSKSVTLKIGKRGRSSLISVAGMLITTNDAFFAARDIWASGKEKAVVLVLAYDAGSERNSEDCDYIPGPPCDTTPNLHDPAVPEGYVHVHAGIHGIGPEGQDPRVDPAEHDWRNPVAKITIRRIYH
jgi:hypothetical protein